MKMVRLISPFRETSNRAVYWSFALAWILVGPLFLIGVARGFGRDAGAALVLLLPVAAAVAMALVFYGSTRFRDSVAPILLIFAGLAATRPRRAPAIAEEAGTDAHRRERALIKRVQAQ